MSNHDCTATPCPIAMRAHFHLGRARLLLDLLADGEHLRGAQLETTLRVIAKEIESATALMNP